MFLVAQFKDLARIILHSLLLVLLLEEYRCSMERVCEAGGYSGWNQPSKGRTNRRGESNHYFNMHFVAFRIAISRSNTCPIEFMQVLESTGVAFQTCWIQLTVNSLVWRSACLTKLSSSPAVVSH